MEQRMLKATSVVDQSIHLCSYLKEWGLAYLFECMPTLILGWNLKIRMQKIKKNSLVCKPMCYHQQLIEEFETPVLSYFLSRFPQSPNWLCGINFIADIMSRKREIISQPGYCNFLVLCNRGPRKMSEGWEYKQNADEHNRVWSGVVTNVLASLTSSSLVVKYECRTAKSEPNDNTYE